MFSLEIHFFLITVLKTGTGIWDGDRESFCVSLNWSDIFDLDDVVRIKEN